MIDELKGFAALITILALIGLAIGIVGGVAVFVFKLIAGV